MSCRQKPEQPGQRDGQGDQVHLLGVRIDLLSMEEAVARIEQFIQDGSPHHVVTADASAILRAYEDPRFREILGNASLVVPDGIGVVWAARLFGRHVPERVPGVELVERLCALSAEKGYTVFLLGAAPGVAEEAARVLSTRYPGLRVVGTHHGYFRPEEEEGILARIQGNRPHLLFVALGVPAQEAWIARHRDILGVPVSIGVGGSFDVLSGRLRRAPRWMQRLGLEWLFRLLQEPWRWRRILALPRFVWLVAKARVSRGGV
ncbi:MAG: WecB/TagA/CpsF family glycosyltransferase [Armatimonadota bacterium]|nr:WecB/TagA/CpsF family glycosyltransferase [Armatimonadota bacterium]